MGKVVIIQDQICNFNKVMETIIKSQMKMLGKKKHVTEMKTAFKGFITRLDIAEERIR